MNILIIFIITFHPYITTMGDWECNSCTLINDAMELQCTCCGSSFVGQQMQEILRKHEDIQHQQNIHKQMEKDLEVALTLSTSQNMHDAEPEEQEKETSTTTHPIPPSIDESTLNDIVIDTVCFTFV